MIDWQSYGPIYTVAPGIKKIGDLPIIEFDQEEQRYLNLKRKVKDNIFFDSISIEPIVRCGIQCSPTNGNPNLSFDILNSPLKVLFNSYE